MLLAELTFNRALIKTPHPMYERFWLVSWIKISPKHLKNLWVFKNEQEWEEAKKNRTILDLIMDKYTGDYFIWFKSDNGVYGGAVVDFEYVNRYGNSLSILGASFTEKSAWGAAKKAIEDKGHRWDENLYSLLSVEPRDNSIFKLDRDEDIDAIAEGMGSQAIEFADYVGQEVKVEKVRTAFMALGKALFKDGWTFYGTHASPRFTKADPDQDGVMGWTISFPHSGDSHLRSGIITAQWIGMKWINSDTEGLCHYTYHESADAVMNKRGLETFKNMLFMSARKMR